jgi:hypothetical protein
MALLPEVTDGDPHVDAHNDEREEINYRVDIRLVNAKGDILIGSTDNALGRLPIGTNGQVLTADSTQSLGVKWATPSGGGGGGGTVNSVNSIEPDGAGNVELTAADVDAAPSSSVNDKVVCWPTGSEPSFAGEPDGTLWIEYTP